MKIFSAENITKGYGEKQLFDKITFHIAENDNIGIIGVNGTGKSSLLKILAGEEQPDAGILTHPKDYTIAYLSQEPELDESLTVLDQVFQSKAAEIQLMNAYENALLNLEEDPENEFYQKRLFDLQKRMDAEDGWDASTNAKTILSKLGIENLSQKIGQLSGGQKKRVALAQVLIEKPDLLLLDEPTNHLDYDSIKWLEGYLNRYSKAAVTVTHDRYFLDQITNKIIELFNGNLYSYQGNYEAYLESKAIRAEQEIQAGEKRKNLYKQELAWMKRGAKARSTKQKARIQRFEQLESEYLQTQPETSMDIALEGNRLGKQVIELKNATLSFDNKMILDNFQLLITRQARIGIVGNNGSGKSTLLNIISGKICLDQGELTIGQTVKIAYYTQETEQLDEDKRMIAYIREAGEVIETTSGETISAAQMLEKFLFPMHTHGTMISRLSGGERRRLYLLKLLMGKPNVLLLDEPTNDLDTETLTVLENYIEDFPGVVISVSHDRYFLDKTAKQLLIFQGNGRIESFLGTYSEYLETSVQNEIEKKVAEKKEDKPSPQRNKQAIKKMTYKEKIEWETIEDKINEAESRLDLLNENLNNVGSDYEKAQELTDQINQQNQLLEDLISRWTYLSELNE